MSISSEKDLLCQAMALRAARCCGDLFLALSGVGLSVSGVLELQTRAGEGYKKARVRMFIGTFDVEIIILLTTMGERQVMSGKIDLFLSRVSHISQFVLVAFAIFGYFYTVRPIYQKELLSEDIAKKEVELKLLKNKLSESEVYLSSNRDKQLKLESDISKLNAQYVKAESQLASITVRLNQAEKNLTKQKLITKNTLEMNTQNLEDLYWENLSALVASGYIAHAAWLANNTRHDNKRVYQNYMALYITPYDAINKALQQDSNFISSAKNIPNSLRNEINEKVRQKLNENKTILSMYPDDFYNKISSVETTLQSSERSNDAADVIKAHELEREVSKYIYDKNLDSQNIAINFINKLKNNKQL